MTPHGDSLTVDRVHAPHVAGYARRAGPPAASGSRARLVVRHAMPPYVCRNGGLYHLFYERYPAFRLPLAVVPRARLVEQRDRDEPLGALRAALTRRTALGLRARRADRRAHARVAGTLRLCLRRPPRAERALVPLLQRP